MSGRRGWHSERGHQPTPIETRVTKYISHLYVTTGKDYVGTASDSCWLFKVIAGKMNAFTELAEISVDDEFIRYLQVGDGPMISTTDPVAASLFCGPVFPNFTLFIGKDFQYILI
jgi:hypothetical protein